jgi:hypothetical protein
MPDAQFATSLQALQVRSLVADPAVAAYWPAAHVVHAVQEVWFVDVVKPEAQGVQPRSFIAVAAVVTDAPAAQLVHGVQEAWFAVDV